MNKTKVIIIDDGINLTSISKYVKKVDTYEVKEKKVIKYNSEETLITHGSKCAAIFTSYAKQFELISLKVMDNKAKTNINYLIIALEWCLNNDIKLISLSIGSSFFLDYDKLKPIVDKLIKKGVIIVAANNNNNKLTYPAAISGVIGVRCDNSNKLKCKEYSYNKDDMFGIEVTAASFSEEFKDLNIKNHNSYITPYIAALVCNYIGEGIDKLEEIHKELQKGSKKDYIYTFSIQKPMKILDDFKNDIYISNEFSICNKYSDIEPLNISVTGSVDDIINNEFVIQLVEIFRKEGFNAIVITDCKLYNEIYCFTLDNNKNNCETNENFVGKYKLIQEVTNPDIVFLIFNNYNITSSFNIQIDCFLKINKETNYKIQLQTTESKVNYKLEDVKELYNKILKEYS